MSAMPHESRTASLSDRIRSQAAISDRPGQMQDLERIAAEVEALQAVLADGVAYFEAHAADNETGRWWLAQIRRVFSPHRVSL